MSRLKSLLFTGLIAITLASCSDDDGNNNLIEVSGTVEKQGVTTYQYGTHTAGGYALRSSKVNLDDYLNQSLTLVGYKIDGYPVDGDRNL